MATYKQHFAPKIPHIPYLSLPIKQKFVISEGFIYSKQEHTVHREYLHKAIDFAVPFGTPIYAAAAGYAVASYHRRTLTNNDGTIMTLNGQPLGIGYGYFVQIFHPEKVCKIKGGRITQYGHLSKIADDIHIKITPKEEIDLTKEIEGINNRRRSHKLHRKQLNALIHETAKIIEEYPWVKYRYGYNFGKNKQKKQIKESYIYTLKELEEISRESNNNKEKKFITWVEQGQLIGYTGTSGIIHGKLHYQEGVADCDFKPYPIWDEVHLHFEESARDEKTHFKHAQRDPFGIYKSAKWYKDISTDEETLFKK